MRNFSDFLTAYQEYAQDGFCPPQFHFWTGLSLLSGILERRIWLPQGHMLHYPNIFVLLVSHPSMGKSTALERGVDLLEDFRAVYQPDFKIIPSQATEAALVDMMKVQSSFQVGSTIVQYSSGYFHASEASSSALKNEHGDFNATLTAFYDCPKYFRKKIKGDSSATEIKNVSFSVLAATTFDFLKRLVNDDSVMGGLASRFVYVVCRDRYVREAKWGQHHKTDPKFRKALVADLYEMSKFMGPLHPDPEFIAAWEEWHPHFDRYVIKLNDPKKESILARKGTNLLKVCILVAMSEGATTLTRKHWNRALEAIENTTQDNFHILNEAIMAKTETQIGLTTLIVETLKKRSGKMSGQELKTLILRQGSPLEKFDATIAALKDAGKIELITVNGGIIYKLKNANTDL